MTTAGHAVSRIGHVSQHHDPASAGLALAELDKARREQREKLNVRNMYFYTTGRVMLAALFVIGAVVKMSHFGDTRDAMETLGLAGATMLLSVAVAIELFAGTLLALGVWVRRSAAFLVAYLAAVTLFIHGDMGVATNRASGLSNLALAGGLLLLVAHGGGAFSLERFFERRAARRR